MSLNKNPFTQTTPKQKPQKPRPMHNPYKHPPTLHKPKQSINPKAFTKQLEIYTQPSIILHLHDSTMDFYNATAHLLDNLGPDEVTANAKEHILSHIITYAQQTINLSNNQCRTHMTDHQISVTQQLMRSVTNYIGIPTDTTPYYEDLTGDDDAKLPAKPTPANPTVTPSRTSTKRQKVGHEPIVNTFNQTRVIEPKTLAALMHEISKQPRITCDLPAAKPQTWTSAQLAMANAIWYNNKDIAKNLKTIENTTTQRPFESTWVLEPTVHNPLNTCLPKKWNFKRIKPSLHQLFTYKEQGETFKNINICRYPIIAELICKASGNEISPRMGFSTFITVHQPSCTFVVSDNRRERHKGNPVVYRYGKLVQSYNTDNTISQRLGQKIFPKWKLPDQYNGNSRTSLQLLKAYVIITPNAPCAFTTGPYIGPSDTPTAPQATYNHHTPQLAPRQLYNTTATTVNNTRAGHQRFPGTHNTTATGTANNGTNTGNQEEMYTYY